MTCLAGGITPSEIVLNGLSKKGDVAGDGRHMSNHFAKPSIHIQNVSSVTGNHAQHAVGLARAIRKYNDDAIVFYSGGESAASEGYFYEAVNGASREMLPVVFVMQNNRFGISVPVSEQSANPIVAENFSSFLNLKMLYCDGTDVVDSWRAMQEAVETIQTKGCAVMVHADCVRIGSHSNSDNHLLYRNVEEIENDRKKDPLPKFKSFLLSNKFLSENEIQYIENEGDEVVREACAIGEKAPDPDSSTIFNFVCAENIPNSGIVVELNTPDEDNQYYTEDKLTLLQGLNLSQKEEFRRNEHTFFWGQDVASKDKGGIFNVDKGMLKEFGPRRVFNAPIAEDFIVGTANGFSRYRDDIWVLIEGAEFADYIWPAMEQIVELSHEYWRNNGQFLPNIVIRIASGGYIGGGLYHSQNVESSFITLPGLRIVTPAFGDDVQGLMRSAFRTRGVTVVLEPKFLYNNPWSRTRALKQDIVIPFGKARYRRYGNDISIISYGTTVHHALVAAKHLKDEYNCEVEVLDLRTVAPLDKDAILATARKTGRILIVHEDKVTGGVGGEISAIISEHAFEYLDAPIVRLGSTDTPVGFAKVLEDAILPNPKKIIDAALKLWKY
ncbi:hypothetical protein CHS0354_024175 [Potamilus streckersoni]|uniref:Pyruvate dehydrogenase E1 component subunit beta, mitochondrial n=1 Tax=Potamilus streckersoni TaxID=2493646 RepID=A0AAE0RZK6_9BIVA|nr:hypothetical protein CHS0354_024175 [Potamilus streckersoni]